MTFVRHERSRHKKCGCDALSGGVQKPLGGGTGHRRHRRRRRRRRRWPRPGLGNQRLASPLSVPFVSPPYLGDHSPSVHKRRVHLGDRWVRFNVLPPTGNVGIGGEVNPLLHNPLEREYAVEVRYGGILGPSNPLLSLELLFEITEPLRPPALVDGLF